MGESQIRYHNIERNLRRLKNMAYPVRPITSEDIIAAYKDPAISTEFGFNLRGTNPFYVDTKIAESGSSFTLFASFPIIEMIEKHIPTKDRKYLIDGTFDITPFGDYYQVLIIHIEYKNDVSANVMRILKKLNILIILLSDFPDILHFNVEKNG